MQFLLVGVPFFSIFLCFFILLFLFFYSLPPPDIRGERLRPAPCYGERELQRHHGGQQRVHDQRADVAELQRRADLSRDAPCPLRRERLVRFGFRCVTVFLFFSCFFFLVFFLAVFVDFFFLLRPVLMGTVS